jgi:hypothetical protein
MDNIGTAYGVMLHDPQLRRGLLIEHESSARLRAHSRVRRPLLAWLARALHGLALRVDASVSSSADTRQHQGTAIQALISTGPVMAPVQSEGGPS